MQIGNKSLDSGCFLSTSARARNSSWIALIMEDKPKTRCLQFAPLNYTTSLAGAIAILFLHDAQSAFDFSGSYRCFLMLLLFWFSQSQFLSVCITYSSALVWALLGSHTAYSDRDSIFVHTYEGKGLFPSSFLLSMLWSFFATIVGRCSNSWLVWPFCWVKIIRIALGKWALIGGPSHVM